MLGEQVREPLQVLGERLLERLRQFLAFIARGCDQPVDLEPYRLHQGAALPVSEHGRADLDRVAEQSRKPLRLVLKSAVASDLNDGAGKGHVVDAKLVADKLNLSLWLSGDWDNRHLCHLLCPPSRTGLR